MKTVVKAYMRLEGEVNQEWTLTYGDGSIEKFHACEESPRYSGGPLADHPVFNHDRELGNFLIDKCLINMEEFAGLNLNNERDAVEYEMDFERKYVIVTDIQRESTDYETEAVHKIYKLN